MAPLGYILSFSMARDNSSHKTQTGKILVLISWVYKDDDLQMICKYKCLYIGKSLELRTFTEWEYMREKLLAMFILFLFFLTLTATAEDRSLDYESPHCEATLPSLVLCTTDAHHRGASGESAQPLAGPSSPRMQRKAWVEWLTHISQDITEYQRSWTIHPTCCLKTRVIPLLQLFVAITTLLQCPRPQLGIIPMVIRDTSAPEDFAGNTPETGQHLLEIKGFLCRTRRHSQVLGKSIQF